MKSFTAVCLFLISLHAFAECPVAMPYQQILDCVVYEGAGSDYIPNQNSKEKSAKLDEILDFAKEKQTVSTK